MRVYGEMSVWYQREIISEVRMTGMLTVYYVRTAQSLPSQTISHMLPAAQAVSAVNTPHTHPPQAT